MAVSQGEVTLSGPLPPSQTLTAYVPTNVFAGLMITDPTEGALDSAEIEYDVTVGLLTVPAGYSGAPLTRSYYSYGGIVRDDIYAQSAAALTADLDQLVYTPRESFLTVNYSISVSISSTAGGQKAGYETNIIVPATPFVSSDNVSINPVVQYNHGVFTLTGTATNSAGVTNVEISAVLNDGTGHDLGAATLNGDGTFTFRDRIGANQQGFITATETGAAGAMVSTQADYSLTGGLGKGGHKALQTSYTADGSAETATSLFRPDGSRTVDVQASGQTFTSDFFDTFRNHAAPENTFVFDPGHGLDIVRQFRVDRADHDTLSFLGSDFGNSIAAVLQNSADGHGSVVITDPTSADTVRLAGITKAQLTANQGDFAFHT